MKCFERLVKDGITLALPPSLDPPRYAYRPERSDWGRCTLCAKSLERLEKHNTHVCMLFVDFRSSFNTEIPQQLMSTLAPWVCAALDFLTNWPQSVHVWRNISSSPQIWSWFKSVYNHLTTTIPVNSNLSWMANYASTSTWTHNLLDTWWVLFLSELLSYMDLRKFVNTSTFAFMSADSQQSGTPKILWSSEVITFKKVYFFKFQSNWISLEYFCISKAIRVF